VSTQPLSRRLFLLVAAAIVPLALVAGVALFMIAQQQREQVARTGIEVTRALSTAVDAELERSLSVITALSVAKALDNGDYARFHDAMSEVVALDASWLTVLLADPAGNIIVDAKQPLGTPSGPIVERESFEQAVKTGKPAVGGIARGMSGKWAVPLRVPVMRDGKLRYVLTAVVKVDGIREVLDRQRLPPDWVASVFDAKGMRAARSRQHDEFIAREPSPSLTQLMADNGAEGTGLTEALEGDRIYTAYSRSPHTQWTVAIGIPVSLIDTAVWRSVAAYGTGILLSIVLGALVAVLIARSIARPMEALGAAAMALGRREPLVRPQSDIAEIRQVADSLMFAADERARGEAEREDLLRREQQARAIAEAANRSKDEFLAMLGHELRNPLGAISNASQLLQIGNEEAQQHARGVIARQVQHLSRMTDDLLDAGRAMTGKVILQRQSLDLAEAASRAVSTLRATGRVGSRRLALTAHPVWVDADPTRIEQIFGNLLGNALKFTPEGASISVSVAREAGEAVIRITDTGIGMPAALVERVFEPFVQGERPLDRSQGGLGIGLTLVRRLAELHGGSSSAQSDGEGKGSLFTVRLPAIDPPATVPTSATPAVMEPRDVLVVEDNDDARETLCRLLELDGHRVRAAADGVAGLEAVRAAVPEIALIDVGLPRMDGYELARRIRLEIDGPKRPYLVAVTGYGLPEDRERTREAGFDLHLVKPVDPADLAGVLAKR
jgi:signal transduction histidine kinase/CheY-like chemotaxis protein